MKISVSGISKQFEDYTALRNISFTVSQGEVIGIIGSSGSGKTTLLRCCALLESIQTGIIEFQAKSEVRRVTPDTQRNSLAPIRQNIGYVAQDLNLWEERTVLENLILGPTVVLKRSRVEAVQDASELSRELGLYEKLQSRVWQLSGGQRQRVALARAMLMKPEILFLDEVTSSLDPVLTVEVMELIFRLKAQGLSILVVTHHLEFAQTVSDRLMFLSGGRVAQFDTPERVINSPASTEIERFISILHRAR